MAFNSLFPAQRYIIPKTTLQREVLLPPDVQGVITAVPGQRVDGNTVVARGYPPAHHHIIYAKEDLRLRRRQSLEDYLLVEIGDAVAQDQALASLRHDPERGRRIFSPANGVVAGIQDGRIVIRETNDQIELIAGMAGSVTRVIPGRGIIVETVGGVVQGTWGNGKRTVGALKLEPEDGMEFIEGGSINLDWRGSIVVTRRRLTTTNIVIIEEQDIAGVIAPSIDATLIDIVNQMDRAVMITEGFGDATMSNAIYTLFEELLDANFNLRATLDAATPSPFTARRPEVVMSIPPREGEAPQLLEPAERLRRGARVRITRSPHAGQTGIVRELPNVPQPLGNGLRVPVANVELSGGEVAPVPLVNLELYRV
jgi:hypothetical protein